MIVAIDGPAGSGKSSTARAVAERLGFLHVDSGAFYRALTHALLSDGVPEATWDGLRPENLDRLRVAGERAGASGPTGAVGAGGGAGDGVGEAGAGVLRMRVGDQVVTDELRTPEVNAHVSHVARIPAVRDWLLGRIRDLAEREDVVVDGRDIGTVVFPDADLKVFIVADPEVRARRRLAEQGVRTPDTRTLIAEVERLQERDRKDSQREIAPLKRADDAVTVDTTALTFEEQVGAILELAKARAV